MRWAHWGFILLSFYREKVGIPAGVCAKSVAEPGPEEVGRRPWKGNQEGRERGRERLGQGRMRTEQAPCVYL